MNVAVAVVAGLVVGLVLWTLGGGGAIITVPVLVYLLGMSPLAATASSLIIVGSSSLVAAVSHGRAGHVAWGHGVLFAALGLGGTAVGSWWARLLDARALMAAFGVLLVVVASLMFARSRHATEDAARPVASLRNPRTLAATVAAASVVGMLTGLFGVGGGFAIIPALTLLLGFGMSTAVGTSLLVIALNSAVALSARLTGGIVLDWPLVGAFSLAAVAASLVGARLSPRVPAARLQQAFAVLLFVIAGYTVVRSLLA